MIFIELLIIFLLTINFLLTFGQQYNAMVPITLAPSYGQTGQRNSGYGNQPQPPYQQQPPSPYGQYVTEVKMLTICPDGSVPRQDSGGNYVGCLPDKPVCPVGTACWYNGFNYFCCTMAPDEPYKPAPQPSAPSGGGYGQPPAPQGYGTAIVPPTLAPSTGYGQPAPGYGAAQGRGPTGACGFPGQTGSGGCAQPSVPNQQYGSGGQNGGEMFKSPTGACGPGGGLGCSPPAPPPCGVKGCGIPPYPCKGILTATGCWPAGDANPGQTGGYGNSGGGPQPSYNGGGPKLGYNGGGPQPSYNGGGPQPSYNGGEPKSGYNGGGPQPPVKNGNKIINGHYRPPILWYVNTHRSCCKLYPNNQEACPFICDNIGSYGGGPGDGLETPPPIITIPTDITFPGETSTTLLSTTSITTLSSDTTTTTESITTTEEEDEETTTAQSGATAEDTEETEAEVTTTAAPQPLAKDDAVDFESPEFGYNDKPKILEIFNNDELKTSILHEENLHEHRMRVPENRNAFAKLFGKYYQGYER